jgi:hypothetical protein
LAEPSAHFCTQCDQREFNPTHPDDTETISQYVKNQAAMVSRDIKGVTVNADRITSKYGTLAMQKFLRLKVVADEDGEPVPFPTDIGMREPGEKVRLTADTTYAELY